MKLSLQVTNIFSPSLIISQVGLEAFPIPDKPTDTIVLTSINHYLPVHMCPRYFLSDNGTEFKNQLIDQVHQQLGIDHILSAPYHPQSNGKLDVFQKYLKPTLKKLKKQKDPTNWDKYLNQVLASYRVTPNLAYSRDIIFSCLWQRSKPTTTLTSRTNATLPRQSRIWMTQARSPSTFTS